MNKKVQFTHEELEYIKLKVVGYDARLATDEGNVKELQKSIEEKINNSLYGDGLEDNVIPMIKYEITGGLHDPIKFAYQCPNCKKHFNNVAIKKIKFCYHCGQALKKGEKNA